MKIKFNFITYSLLFSTALFAPLSVQAAFNDVTFTADTFVNLSGSGTTLTILSGGQVASYTVGTTTLVFNLENNSSVVVRSTSRVLLSNTIDEPTICTEAYSQLTLNSTITQTVTITPGSSNSCSGSSSGGGGGSAPTSLPVTPPVVPPVSGQHALGTIINSNGTLYTITLTDQGQVQRRPYTSPGAFLSYGFNAFNLVVPASTEDLALPIGEFIPPQDGSVVCSDRLPDKGTCYFITQGQKAGFVSETIFKALGFSFSKALYGDVSFMPTHSPIENNANSHLPGAIVNNNGTIQLVGTTFNYGFPSSDVFLSWGYSFDHTVPATSVDAAKSQNQIVPAKQAGQVRFLYQ